MQRASPRSRTIRAGRSSEHFEAARRNPPRCYATNDQLGGNRDESIGREEAYDKAIRDEWEGSRRRIEIPKNRSSDEVDATNSSGSSRAAATLAIGPHWWRSLLFCSPRTGNMCSCNLTTIVICQLTPTLLRDLRRVPVLLPSFSALTCHHLRPLLFKPTPFYSFAPITSALLHLGV